MPKNIRMALSAGVSAISLLAAGVAQDGYPPSGGPGTAPAISGPTYPASSGAVSLGITTDGAGEVYAVITDANVSLDGPAIVAGTDPAIVGSASSTVAGAGVHSLGTIASLESETDYWVHFVAKAAGQAVYSSVIKASFTTAAAGSSTISNHNITATRTVNITAPGGVQLRSTDKISSAIIGGGNSLQRIESLWDFDDAANALGEFFPALQTQGIDKPMNKARGCVVTKVFNEPGTYNVGEEARDGTSSSTQTIQIQVDDPDVVYAGADTAYFDPDGIHPDAQPGWTLHTTIADAEAALAGRVKQRLLVQAGADHGPISLTNTNVNGRCFVGRVGAGANPHCDESAKAIGSASNGIVFTTSNNRMVETTVDRMDYTGNYSAANTPPVTTQPNGSAVVYNGCHSAHKTCWGQRIRNCGYCHYDLDKFTENFFVSNCDNIGFRWYGWLAGDGGKIGLVGNVLLNEDGARNGSDGKGPPYYADHAYGRLSRPGEPMTSERNFVNSLVDWGGGSSGSVNGGILRWGSGNPALDQNDQSYGSDALSDQILCMCDNIFEGGEVKAYNLTDGSQGVPSAYAFYDGNECMSINHSKVQIAAMTPGWVLRNNIFAIPDVPPGAATGVQSQFSDEPPDKPYLHGKGRWSAFYSNTQADYRSDANARSVSGNQDRPFKWAEYNDLTNTYVGNNAGFSPNMATGAVTDSGTNLAAANVDTSPTRTPYFTTRTITDNAPDSTTYVPPPATTAHLTPLTGSNLIGAASGIASLLDKNMNWREDMILGLGRAASVGPEEVALAA